MNIEKRTIEVSRTKIVSDARFEEIDTGEKLEVKITKEDGKKVVEQQPITRRVFHKAVYEEIKEPKDIFVVKAENGVEEHHFANEEDATRFLNDTAKDKVKRERKK
jgi:hypothetical protein